MKSVAIPHSMETSPDDHFPFRIFALDGLHDTPSLFGCSRIHGGHN